MHSMIGHSNSCSNNVNSPSNLVRCTYGTQQSANNDLQATAVVCQKCASHDVRVNVGSLQNDPCFTRIPKGTQCTTDGMDPGVGVSSWCGGGEGECQNQRGECSANNQEKYFSYVRRNCMPNMGPLSEYQEAYRYRNPRAGPRRYTRTITQGLERPRWNSSMAVPAKPYQETLGAAEAKLRALDTFMDPPHDIMALAIIREQVKEKYRAKRNCRASHDGDKTNYNNNNFGDCDSGTALMRAGAAEGAKTNHPPKPCTTCPAKPATRHLELIDDESVLSA